MIFLILLAVPMIIGLVAEYAACRFPKRRLWRGGPPPLTPLGALAVALYPHPRRGDGGGKAPWETLLFIPGIPALGAFLGLWLGWRLWKRLWLPRVVKERT